MNHDRLLPHANILAALALISFVSISRFEKQNASCRKTQLLSRYALGIHASRYLLLHHVVFIQLEEVGSGRIQQDPNSSSLSLSDNGNAKAPSFGLSGSEHTTATAKLFSPCSTTALRKDTAETFRREAPAHRTILPETAARSGRFAFKAAK